MWKIIWTLSILIFIFLLNLWFYYFNNDYRFFIKKMKSSDEIVYIDENINITDNRKDLSEKNNKIFEVKEDDKKLEEKNNLVDIWIKTIDEKWGFWFWKDYTEYKNEEIIKNDDESIIYEKIKEKEEKKKIIMSDIWREFLNQFYSYKLTKIEVHSSLFDITTEYPDDYIEYISSNLVFYYFPTKDYDSVLDIIEAISFDLPFSVNKLNNFYGESFYINLNKDISDNFVRIVLNYKNNVFWLKIKKDRYNDVKDILKKLELKK